LRLWKAAGIDVGDAKGGCIARSGRHGAGPQYGFIVERYCCRIAET